MKNIVVSIGLMFLSHFAFATPDISVTIDGRVYQCSGNGGSTACDSKVKAFKYNLDTCMVDASESYCREKYWNKFKISSPECVADAIPLCVESCRNSSSAGYCVDWCNR